MSDRFGPNTAQVEAFLALLPGLTEKQWAVAGAAGRGAALAAVLDEAWDTARVADRVAARVAAWYAARGADWYAARAAAWAAEALVVRDLISPEQFDVLSAPMRAAGVNFDELGGNGE